MRIGFLEPHLRTAGGIRRVIELGNALTHRGHEVQYLVPATEPLRCDWMECLGAINPIDRCYSEPFDVLVFNEESQWYLLDLFRRVDLTVYYVLHYAVLYDKAGAYESYRYPVGLLLANSSWTAECIEQEIGLRPIVLLGGINSRHFHPVRVRKSYDVLTYGSERFWKGTREVEEACRKLQVRLESYEGKGLRQDQMAREYCRARVFAVGSYFEGFGQPGLEALACGVPLVTTDNGGCREYAVHEETALVVPPRDSDALAEGIRRLLRDRKLAARLRVNGLQLVKEEFGDWARSASRFEEIVSPALDSRRLLRLAIDQAETDSRLETLRRVRAAHVSTYATPLPLPAPAESQKRASRIHPKLTSIISLSWDQLWFTRKFVESIRANTEGPYELILVDNGSREETRQYVSAAADRCVLNRENLGFAKGMNQGARLAKGEYLVFINNDTEVPPGWLPPLIEAAHLTDRVGIVAPAVTAGGSFVTVRGSTHRIVREVLPFSLPPAAVCYLVPRAAFEDAGGWCEEYRLGSAEDVDLCFTMWVLGRKVVVDERVLIEHRSKGTADAKLDDWQVVWQRNRELLIQRWSVVEPKIASLDKELAEALSVLREAATDKPKLSCSISRIAALLTQREDARLLERTKMAAGVARSWREAQRQRELAVGLRRQLRASLLRRLLRRALSAVRTRGSAT